MKHAALYCLLVSATPALAAGPDRTLPHAEEIWIEAESQRLPKPVQKVEDAEASGRFAVRFNPAETRERGTLWNAQAVLARGRYELRLRMKVGTKGLPPSEILLVQIRQGLRHEVERQVYLKGTDFRTPGRYETVTLPLTRAAQGAWGLQLVATQTPADTWIDRIEIERIGSVTDDELLPANDSRRRRPKDLPVPGGPVLFVRGPYAEFYAIERLIEGLAGRGVQVLDHHFVDNGYPVFDFPEDHPALYRYGTVVLFNVGYGALSPAQRLLLRHYVEDGGGLFVFGEPYGFSRAEIADTFLEEVLPIRIAGRARPLAAPLEPVSGASLPRLDWSTQAQVFLALPVEPRPGASVLVRAGEMPVLVVGHFGKGSVAVFTPSPYGRLSAGTTPFWQWSDLVRLEQAVIDRVAQAAPSSRPGATP